MQYQVHNQWQQHPILLPNQPQSLQQQYLYQEQLYQSQKPLPETSSNSMDSTAQTRQPSGGDWQEEVYRKIKAMKESYLTELSEMYQKIATKLQQHDSLTHQPKSDKIEKLKVFKMMLEHLITFLQVSKSNISPSLKEKLGSYEKQIINFINTIRPRNMSPLQPGQLPPPHMHSMSQTQSQVTQVQLHENQMNNQLQTTNIQGPGATMQQNNMTSMQHSSLSGVSSAQQLISQIQSQLAQLQLGLQQQPESYASTQVNGLKLQVNGLESEMAN
ncbi:mediator of RNA polymerase II transcription subunit 15a-like isoform X1 [Trifolium pratense]|uniref:Uncharacterized protein n=1 Tax=Trifolium pratense TaxID=57577 RepID=A0ACB0KZN4_TRIPR|nr:mediator of RNA polymerase II transcription subunit 15a-like isoform X1 [Trifolium pratense]CAJ2661428.1 unnamed protein product [Trifolium pratense]